MIKVCGTGNDFLILDLVRTPSAKGVSPEEIVSLCHRHSGFGADGFVVLKAHPQMAFEWIFYNSDGKEAEMCGNAARAVSKYFAYAHKKSQFQFLTQIGTIDAEVHQPSVIQGDVSVTLPKWKEYSPDQSSGVGEFAFINSGVPHAVLNVHDISDLADLKNKAMVIKALPQFAKNGVNVTFKSPSPAPNKIHSVTFERGVENFTLSCGTGAIAAAVAQAEAKETFNYIVQVPGGVLSVSFDGIKIKLQGEARIVGTCEAGVVIDESQS